MHGRRSLHPRLENPFIISFKTKNSKEKLILIDPKGSTGQIENNPMTMKNHYIPTSFQRASNIRVRRVLGSFILRSAQQEEALHRIWYALRRWRLVSRRIILFPMTACSSINWR
ncbi:unnamed protein product [Spirodela intermedia]|uniref:Uncharacterized protein n=1 Tax=Spirodela intermedia TaxID=51605 RepID=A0A7I8KFB4_SPIIN|nr:unnamed protein product [Spirodela intermedia]